MDNTHCANAHSILSQKNTLTKAQKAQDLYHFLLHAEETVTQAGYIAKILEAALTGQRPENWILYEESIIFYMSLLSGLIPQFKQELLQEIKLRKPQ